MSKPDMSKPDMSKPDVSWAEAEALRQAADFPSPPADFDAWVKNEASKRDSQIAALQEQLTHEKDARREDRFIFIVIVVLLLDVTFFSVLENFGGPLALLLLELLILIPLARRMGMEEIARICGQVIDRMAGKSG